MKPAGRWLIVSGSLLLVPIAFPIGFLLAGISLTNLDPPSQVALAFGIFSGIPGVLGAGLLSAGLVRWLRTRRAAPHSPEPADTTDRWTLTQAARGRRPGAP
jgi:hypothetical protein